MDNNKKSPLDEIKRITREATGSDAPRGQGSRAPKTPVQPQATPTQVPKPQATPTQVPKPQATPTQAPKPQVTPTQAPKPQATPTQVPKPQATPTQAPQPQVTPAQAPQPQVTPTQAPKPQATPTQAPKPQATPAQAPKPQTTPAQTPVNRVPPKGNAAPLGTDAMSRAEKVRQARENAIRARESVNSETRVMDTTEKQTKIDTAELERQRREARKLIEENAGASNDGYTRVTSTVRNGKKNPKPAEPAQEEYEDYSEDSLGKGVLSGTVKAIIYLVSVLVISGCLALFVILVGNDCFAFVKSDAEVVVTIPEDATLSDIAKELKSNGVIEYPSMFKLYVNIRGKNSDEYIAGDHTVNAMMGYDTLIAQFKPTNSKEEITVTIIEGSTTQDIIDLFVSKGIGTQEGFEKAIAEYDGDFWFLKELPEDKVKDRIYRLDGYLFPDTYNFFTTATEEDVLYKLLSNFEAKFDEENKARAKELGMTVDDIIILASIIQKEAMYVTDYPLVSSVFHNRINNESATNGLLQSNATVQYTMPKEEVELELSYAQIDKYDNGYNTFKYKGLPVGPICNSSLNALNWALYPTDTDYYYFVSDKDGYNHYATTWEEHDKNVQTYQGDDAE